MGEKQTAKNEQRKEPAISEHSEKSRPIESLREWVGLITAGAGIFAALLYLAGRSFASGYFAAMNIPSYQVSFTLWEYGEVAWIPLLLYPIGMMAATAFLSGIASRIMDWLSPFLVRVISWFKSKIKIKLPSVQLPDSSRQTRFWFLIAWSSVFVLLLMTLVIFTLQFVREFGKLNGRTNVLENSAQVELVSTIPLALDDNYYVNVQSGKQDFYSIKDLYLLTVNNNIYYLFNEVDPATCKPVKVYVVEARETLQVNLLPVISLKDQCNEIAVLTPSPSSPTTSP